MMQLRLTLLFCLLLGHCALAEVLPFYISTGKGIYRDTLDTGTGKLGTPTLAVAAVNSNFLALSPDNQFLFATLGDTVGSFQVQPDGTLKPLNEQPSGGGTPCHVSLDKTGHDVFVANYDGGNIASFAVDGQGRIGERTAFIQFTGSGPDPNRQTKSYAHSVYADPENKFVYSCDLGSDSVWIFKFDAGHGALVPADPPVAKVPPGSGPRHLAFHPGGKFVYVVSEMGISVTVFARDPSDGALTALQTVSALPRGTPAKNVNTAEIFCHPSGQWLYASLRGADKIAVFAIASDGRLKLIQNAFSVARFPRSFALDPTGQWLITAGQQDNRIALLRIDPASGLLTPTDQTAAVAAPVCVLFVPKK
ncbi:MAG: lactonase family protein [Methylacidiphilales bacterium]|nr:lactonase family protein [Candidatus Methylacidiphilales bacterium]